MWFDLEILEASRFVRDSIFELAQAQLLRWPRLQVREAGGNKLERAGRNAACGGRSTMAVPTAARFSPPDD